MKMPGPPGRFCPWCFEEGKRVPLRPPRGPVRQCVVHGEKSEAEVLAKIAGKEQEDERST
jgi:hypothetical protein